MVPSGQNVTNHGFFGPTSSGTAASGKPERHSTFEDVGRTGDSGFRAVALAFIDSYLTHPHMDDERLITVLNRHFSYFSQEQTVPVTPADRLQYLSKEVRLSELQYTLRQMAVDEICANPANYRGAFVTPLRHITPEEMRRPTTWIEQHCFAAAMAKVLGIPIEVKVVDSRKTLPMRCFYHPSEDSQTNTPPIVIQLQGNRYSSQVGSSARYATLVNQIVGEVQPVSDSITNDPSLSEILTIIDNEDKHLVKVYEQTHHRLAAMVKAEELNKADLLAIYVTGIARNLSGRTAYVGVAHGSQQFFDAIMHPTISHADEISHDKQLIDELVDAIAREISIHGMCEDDIYAKIDDRREKGSQLTSTMGA